MIGYFDDLSDAIGRGEVEESLLTDIARARTIPVIVNMHDVELARRFADRIVGMAGGRIVFEGPPAKLSDETLKTIYGGEDWLH